MRGTISSAGFESGDRFVVGRWLRSPVGTTIDVMWARPDGHRVLLAPDDRTAEFVTAVYSFDEVRLVDFTTDASVQHLDVVAGPVELRLDSGRPWRIPFRRPRWFTRLVEAPIARAAMGVQCYGVSPTGVTEWYQADALRWVTAGRARLDGRDLGSLTSVAPVCGFGFSEPPARPSIVEVRPQLRGLVLPRSGVGADEPDDALGR
jgi:hypothetical protein